MGNEELVDLILRSVEVELVLEVMPTIFGGAAARDQLATERWVGELRATYKLRGNPGRESRNRQQAHIWEVSAAAARAAATGSAKASDDQVRAAVISMFGGRDEAFGRRCRRCKGKGWIGRDHVVCGCKSGWDPAPGPLHGWTGSHVFRAYALALAVWRPGGIADCRNASPPAGTSPASTPSPREETP